MPSNQNQTVIPAADVRTGDTVLGTVLNLGGRPEPIYHSDPYVAAPQANKPGCQCPGHEALTDEDRSKTLVVLYDGEIWDYACDVLPADAHVIVERPEPGTQTLPAMDRTDRGWEFEHNGTTDVHPTRDDAVRAATTILDGDTSGQSSYDTRARRVSL